MASQAERAARNEALFREINERINELTDSQRGEWLSALCECSDPDCTQTIDVTPAEYASVRARGNRFANCAGHVLSEVEHVVEQNDRFCVVEKIGEGSDVAHDLDPRS